VLGQRDHRLGLGAAAEILVEEIFGGGAPQ
jgi:hypothetical protein